MDAEDVFPDLTIHVSPDEELLPPEEDPNRFHAPFGLADDDPLSTRSPPLMPDERGGAPLPRGSDVELAEHRPLSPRVPAVSPRPRDEEEEYAFPSFSSPAKEAATTIVIPPLAGTTAERQRSTAMIEENEEERDDDESKVEANPSLALLNAGEDSSRGREDDEAAADNNNGETPQEREPFGNTAADEWVHFGGTVRQMKPSSQHGTDPKQRRSSVSAPQRRHARTISQMNAILADRGLGHHSAVAKGAHAAKHHPMDHSAKVVGTRQLTFTKSVFRDMIYWTSKARLTMTVWIVFAILEVALITLHVMDSTFTNDQDVSWMHYTGGTTPALVLFYVKSFLCFLSIAQFFFLFAHDIASGVVLLSTTLAQLAMFIGSFWDDGLRTAYVPFYFRVWVLRRWLVQILQGVKLLSPPKKRHHMEVWGELGYHVYSFAALLFTFSGVFRDTEVMQGYPLTYMQALYFAVVTVATVGYGDILPHTDAGMIVVIVFVFYFVSRLPKLLEVLNEVTRFVEAVRGYDLPSRHVVVFGSPSYKEMVTVLNEFLEFSNSRCVVFVLVTPPTERMRALESTPRYRNRIVLVEARYLREPMLLDRCRATEAGGIFILSDKNASHANGDLQVLVASRMMDLRVRRVPQFLWLRLGTHTSLLKSSHIFMVHDMVKKTILSTALLMPGVIPFLVNLVRISGAQHPLPSDLWSNERIDDWRNLYKHSRQCTITSLIAPPRLHGKTMEFLTLHLFPLGAIILGIIGPDEAAPHMDLSRVVRQGDLLIAMTQGLDKIVLVNAIEDLLDVIDELPDDLASTASSLNSAFPRDLVNDGSIFYPFDRLADNSTFAFTSRSTLNQHCRDINGVPIDSFEFLDRRPGGVDLKELRADRHEAESLLFLIHQRETLVKSDAHASLIKRAERDVQEVLEELATKHCEQCLDDEREEKKRLKNSYEKFVLIDHTTVVNDIPSSIDDEKLSERIVKQDLILMMQCLRSMHTTSMMTLLTLRGFHGRFLRRWSEVFNSQLRLVRGHGVLLSHVEATLQVNRGRSANTVRGVLVFASQQGKASYGDMPAITTERNVRLLFKEAMMLGALDPLQERQIVVELRSATSCGFVEPRHTDLTWMHMGDENFQYSLSFMMGKCFSSDMLQTILVHSFYNPVVLPLYRLMLNVSVTDARVNQTDDAFRFDRDDEELGSTTMSPKTPGGTHSLNHSRTRFKFYSNRFIQLKTFGDAFRMLLRLRSSIAIGVFRRFPAHEKLEGTPRYFVTFPDPAMPLRQTDVIYALFAGSVRTTAAATTNVSRRTSEVGGT